MHERNPICIQENAHLAELIKLRFDASDAKQDEIKEQVEYTNGRTRKLEDHHISQIAINKELLEFLISQKEQNNKLVMVTWLGGNWGKVSAAILGIATLYLSLSTLKSEANENKRKSTYPSKSGPIDSTFNGSTNSYQLSSRSCTLY